MGFTVAGPFALASGQEAVVERQFVATIEKSGKWYIGYVEGMPGVNTQGRTLKEVSENLKDAIILILETQEELWPQEPAAKVYKKTIVVDAPH